MDITFHKMHGLGNDFVLLDCRASAFTLSAQQIRALGNRRTGVGFDQLLVLEQSSQAGIDARYRIFNQDGSAAEHCGNGIRCVAAYLHARLTVSTDTITVEIDGRRFKLFVQSNGEIRVDMGAPIFAPAQIPTTFERRATKYSLNVLGTDYELGAVSMGNPHAVFLVDDVANFRVAELGQEMQRSNFFPNQVNAGFMQINDEKNIDLRVWERGAGETMACGTGACAAVVVGKLWGMLADTVKVHLPGGVLTIEWAGADNDKVWMTGPASYVFEGRITL